MFILYTAPLLIHLIVYRLDDLFKKLTCPYIVQRQTFSFSGRLQTPQEIQVVAPACKKHYDIV